MFYHTILDYFIHFHKYLIFCKEGDKLAKGKENEDFKKKFRTGFYPGY